MPNQQQQRKQLVSQTISQPQTTAPRSDVQHLDITANPKGEGTYKALDPSGNVIAVPYSKVNGAAAQGYDLLPYENRRYGRDYRADPNPVQPTIAANPKGEGTYAMQDVYGRDVLIPYSNVGDALYKGYKIGTAEHSRYVDDLQADPHPAAPGKGLPIPNAPSVASVPASGQTLQAMSWKPATTQAEYGRQQREYAKEVGKSANAIGIPQAAMPVRASLGSPSVPVSTQISNDVGNLALSTLTFALDPKSGLQGMFETGNRFDNELARGTADGGFSGWNIPNAASALMGGDPEAAREEWARGNHGRALTQYMANPALGVLSSMVGPGAGEGAEAVSPAMERAGEYLQDTASPKVMDWALNGGKEVHLNGAEPGASVMNEGAGTSFSFTKDGLAKKLGAAAARDSEAAAKAVTDSKAELPASTVQGIVDNVIDPKIQALQGKFGITNKVADLNNLRSEFDPYLDGRSSMPAADVYGLLQNLNEHIFNQREIDPTTNEAVSAAHEIHNGIADQLYAEDPSLQEPLQQAHNTLTASKLAASLPDSKTPLWQRLAGVVATNGLHALKDPQSLTNVHALGGELFKGVPGVVWPEIWKSVPLRSGAATGLNALGEGLSGGIVSSGVAGGGRALLPLLSRGYTTPNGYEGLDNRTADETDNQVTKQPSLNHDIVDFHSSQLPSSSYWPRNLTPQSIPPSATGQGGANFIRQDLPNSGSSPFSRYLQSPSEGNQSAPTYKPSSFGLPQASAGSTDQNNQDPWARFVAQAQTAFRRNYQPPSGFTPSARNGDAGDIT
jgi:hypothetical protein